MKFLPVLFILLLIGCTDPDWGARRSAFYWYPIQSIKLDAVPVRMDVGLDDEYRKYRNTFSGRYNIIWYNSSIRGNSNTNNMMLSFVGDTSLNKYNLDKIVHIDSVRTVYLSGDFRMDLNSEFVMDTTVIIKSNTCSGFLRMLSCWYGPFVLVETLPDSFMVDAFLHITPPDGSGESLAQEYSFVLKREFIRCSYDDFQDIQRRELEKLDEIYSGCE